MSGSASYCDRGYVAFLNATYPMSPSGLMDCDRGGLATGGMSPSGFQCDTRCVAFSGSGLKARAPELFPLSRIFPFPLFPSRPLGVPAVLGVPPPC
ncbi:hypothetical protein Taro_018771 [Colocasia esculenta]|uniref:Uncharacterized protein n=1 Tax=Colocasia esculenta TaxID=4460 RepID=A0A843V3E8_COLES|nr:hypothetical protein [Colocasia esculenta]